jgi:RsiW-degrading membrane proteinase PrsW (M82 family)
VSGALPTGIGLTLALLPIPVLLAGTVYLDRLEPEPPGTLVLIFLCGAAAAALIGLAGTLTGTDLITTPALRPSGFATASAASIIGIAVLEEALKAAALTGLLLRRPQEIDGIHDGVVYGSMVGLGFALIENLFYYSQAAHYGFSDVATTFVLRGVLSPLCQVLFSSLVGAGVAVAARFGLRRGLWAVGAGFAAAVALHALWNDSLGSGVARLALTYAFFAVIFLVLLVSVIADRRRIIALIVRYVPEHKAAAVATDLDVAMLGSLADRRQARQWARLHAGLAGLRAMSEYQLGATELGLLHRRADRGLVGAGSFADQCDTLLADMRSANTALLGRLNRLGRLNPVSHPPWAPYGPSCFSQEPADPVPPPPAAARAEAAPEPAGAAVASVETTATPAGAAVAPAEAAAATADHSPADTEPGPVNS